MKKLLYTHKKSTTTKKNLNFPSEKEKTSFKVPPPQPPHHLPHLHFLPRWIPAREVYGIEELAARYALVALGVRDKPR